MGRFRGDASWGTHALPCYSHLLGLSLRHMPRKSMHNDHMSAIFKIILWRPKQMENTCWQLLQKIQLKIHGTYHTLGPGLFSGLHWGTNELVAGRLVWEPIFWTLLLLFFSLKLVGYRFGLASLCRALTCGQGTQGHDTYQNPKGHNSGKRDCYYLKLKTNCQYFKLWTFLILISLVITFQISYFTFPPNRGNMICLQWQARLWSSWRNDV